VSELLDYLDEAFEFPDGRAAEQYLVAEHPLHAFSPEYFAGGREGDRLFSYSQANAEASRAIQSGQDPATRPFIELPLPEPPTPIREIELAQLVRFWSNPCEYFIRRRLGFRLGEPEEGLEADEPFSLGAWEQYPIKQELVADRLGFAAGGSPQAIAARGVLPPGAIGKLQLRSAAAEAERFARIVRNHLAVLPRKQPRDIKLALGDLTLSGRLNSLHGDGTLHFRCALLKPKDQLRAWIEHLALCASEERAPHESALIGTDAVISFSNAGDAAGQLATLCRLFLEGTRRPLPFFPAAALAYAEAELDNAADPMKPALQKWKGTREQPGEKSSPYIACCFGAGAPLPEEFVSLAREVCRPLVSGASMQKIG
jgi:exodeoxyribonuclease V gamma subunit